MLLLRRKHPSDDAALLRRAPELAVRVDEPRDDEREDRDDVDDLVRAPRVAPGPADGGEDRDDGRRDEYDHDAVAAPGRHALDAAAQRVQDPADAAGPPRRGNDRSRANALVPAAADAGRGPGGRAADATGEDIGLESTEGKSTAGQATGKATLAEERDGGLDAEGLGGDREELVVGSAEICEGREATAGVEANEGKCAAATSLAADVMRLSVSAAASLQ